MRAQSCNVCISKSACLSVIERNLPFSCSLPISESARLLVCVTVPVNTREIVYAGISFTLRTLASRD